MANAAADTSRVWGLVAREYWRRIKRRLRAGPVYRWRFSGRTPERVLIAPPDLRLADREIAAEIYAGRFPFAGHFVDTGGLSPFMVEVHHPPWQEALHGFRWLRHLREAGTELASANARALTADWIETHGRRIEGVAWEPEVTAWRIIAWLQHSTTVLQGAEFPFYRSYLKSIAVQIRYLRSMTPEMKGGDERLRARIALAFAALSLPVASSTLRSASRNLAIELDRQILPDGGHISRNPHVLLELLADLLPLRHTYTSQGAETPAALIGAVERMLPALRFFRHQDGNLAHFNGMGATIPDRVAAILRHDDTAGAPLLNASFSGYQRMVMGGTTVIADTGAPPPVDVSADAHAGCLSFEMSSGRHQFIVNAGIDTYGPQDYRALARVTAAHSTATLNDASSCRFNSSSKAGELLGTPLVAGPRRVVVDRHDADRNQSFRATHDGYLSRYGLLHEREIALSHDGSVVDGKDRIARQGGGAARGGDHDRVTVRFHLHPDIELFRDEADRFVLTGAGADTWVFTASLADVTAEESLFFAGIAGPQKTSQLVLAFRASETPEVTWRLTRTAIGGGTMAATQTDGEDEGA
ncbi:MAG: heparinase II/III family protein [Rhizobiaceae bacterium]